jgi:hypothetical protein
MRAIIGFSDDHNRDLSLAAWAQDRKWYLKPDRLEAVCSRCRDLISAPIVWENPIGKLNHSTNAIQEGEGGIRLVSNETSRHGGG